MPDIHIKLVSLSKKFGETIAVDHLSLNVEKGSLMTLLGPSGCGKTTTLRIIAGFENADEGKIYLGDRFLNEVPAHRRNVGMVFQSYALFPHMNVFDNVAYGLKTRKWGKSEIKEKVREVLSLMNLVRLENRSPGQLSGGQQQRVAVARALSIEPEVLLMDEPLSNLDAKLRIDIRSEIRALQQRLAITTIYVTHDQEEALSVSDRIAIMKDGKLQQISTPWEIYHNPRDQFVADFIGMANFVKAKIETVDEERVILNTPGGRLVMFREKGLEFSTDQDILVAIRPEGIRVNKYVSVPPTDNILKGEIRQYSYLGKMLKYWVDVGEGMSLIVEHPDPREILTGKVYLTFDRSRIRPIPIK